MADLVVSSATVGVRLVSSEKAILLEMDKAAVALLAGQLVFENTTGAAALTDSDAAATMPAKGIVYLPKAAGDPVTIVRYGMLSGYDLSALNGGAPIYASGTPGMLSDTIPAGTGKVAQIVGRVHILPTTLEKVLLVECLSVQQNLATLP